MSTRKPPAPARLYVLLARDASSAIILRRGPSEWVQLIRWNTATDTFEPGHWFKGNLYGERCDLSPSGDRFIYLAAKHGGRYADPTYTHVWTAISKVPYLTAVALWSNQGGTYFGGGLFGDENTIWLNSEDAVYREAHSVTPHPNHQPPEYVTVIPNPVAFLSDGKWLYYQHPEYARWIRDGWTWEEDGISPVFDILQREDVRRQYLPRDLYRRGRTVDWVLHLQLPTWLKGDEKAYFLHRHGHDSPLIETLEGVEWADWDQQGRLVCARDGKLFQITPPERREELMWREIADFNDAKPHLIPPPEWATKW